MQPSLLDAVRRPAATEPEVSHLVVGCKPVLDIRERGDRRIDPMLGTNRMYVV